MTVIDDFYSSGYYGYEGALKAAGAEVHAYKEFGSYQGDWVALVTHEGHTGWVKDYFGSCSGCDAFQGEFMYGEQQTLEKVAEFGAGYLEDILTTEQVLERFEENAEWDVDAQEAIKWIKTQVPNN